MLLRAHLWKLGRLFLVSFSLLQVMGQSSVYFHLQLMFTPGENFKKCSIVEQIQVEYNPLAFKKKFLF